MSLKITRSSEKSLGVAPVASSLHSAAIKFGALRFCDVCSLTIHTIT